MKRALLLIAATLATAAHASYAQMRLDGVALVLAFGLAVAAVAFVHVALSAGLFRHRIVLVVGSIAALAVALLFLSLAASSGEREVFFKLFSGGSGPLVLLVTSAVFLPFIVVAPLAQYLALREGRRWPRWISAWRALQLAMLPTFIALAVTDDYFWQREHVEAQALGSQVKAGAVGALLERAERRRERIWGTGWTYPWPAHGATSSSGWPLGLSLGLEASALIAANEPLSEPDRTALLALMERHIHPFSGPQVWAKLIWDELEPGEFSRQLAPAGVNEAGVVSEEVIPVLLERLEKYGEAGLCPGGRMMDADRALLSALVLNKGRVWSVAKHDYEMRPDWASYPQRVERLCPGPPTAGSDRPAAG